MVSIRAFVRRHRPALAVAAALGLGLVVFVLVWFQPQKLFINTTVHDPLPPALAALDRQPASARVGTGHRPSPALVSRAALQSRGHPTSGTASVYRLRDRSLLLRFDELRTTNGPDLRVRLAMADAEAGNDDIDDGALDLGGLKGNRGDQNYVIPEGTDLTRYHAVIIWCRRFSYVFGSAPILGG